MPVCAAARCWPAGTHEGKDQLGSAGWRAWQGTQASGHGNNEAQGGETLIAPRRNGLIGGRDDIAAISYSVRGRGTSPSRLACLAVRRWRSRCIRSTSEPNEFRDDDGDIQIGASLQRRGLASFILRTCHHAIVRKAQGHRQTKSPSAPHSRHDIVPPALTRTRSMCRRTLQLSNRNFYVDSHIETGREHRKEAAKAWRPLCSPYSASPLLTFALG